MTTAGTRSTRRPRNFTRSSVASSAQCASSTTITVGRLPRLSSSRRPARSTGRAVPSCRSARRPAPACSAMSCSGPSGRGRNNASQAPHSTRAPWHRVRVKRSTRALLPIPASPLTSTTAPRPASASRRASPRVWRGPSRSSRSIAFRFYLRYHRAISPATPDPGGPMSPVIRPALALLLLSLLAAPAAAQSSAPREGKPGGILRFSHREDLPQGFAIHETATNSGTWPSMPCYSNLVIFDQSKQLERPENIVPELAERWSWQDGYRNLVFFLRRDVRWHDGQPFTSKDVKFTFDMVREAPNAAAKLRLNPRKEWYSNVDAIEAPDPYTVVFRLKRPQPSILTMLASGYSPVLPAHVPPAEHRTRCIGTGPLKFKEWKRGESVELVKNPDYFVKGRPYLDAVRYVIIVERGTRVAALQANQVDVAFPGETTLNIYEQLKAAVPKMVFTETASNVNENLLINTTRPPFDNVK